MKILALEFSSPMRSVAAVSGNGREGFAEERGGRETKAFGLIEEALRQAGISRQEVECIAVGLGPGSYAGIRIAIAIAQGWQVAWDVKLLGISSAEVMAAQASQSRSNELVLVGLEAQRGQLYVARYDASVLMQPKLIEPFRLGERGNAILYRMDWLPEMESGRDVALPPRADFLARLASHRTDYVPGFALEPVYLRRAEFVKAPAPRFSTL